MQLASAGALLLWLIAACAFLEWVQSYPKKEQK